MQRLPKKLLDYELDYKFIPNEKWQHIAGDQCIEKMQSHRGDILKANLKLSNLKAELQIRSTSYGKCGGELVLAAINLRCHDKDLLKVHLDNQNQLAGKPQPPKWEHVKGLIGHRNSIRRLSPNTRSIRLEIRYWKLPDSPCFHDESKVRVVTYTNPDYVITWWKNIMKILRNNKYTFRKEKGLGRSGTWVDFSEENFYVPVVVGLANFGLALRQVNEILQGT